MFWTFMDLFSGKQAYFVTFEPMMNFDILRNFECSKPVQHIIFVSWGGALKPMEEKGDLLTPLTYYNGVEL